ncbi:TPA: alpha/beta hydrolase, partial [Legionella pneumophila]|nr:alpha/beta hydrolase [Legionella pneumophila]
KCFKTMGTHLFPMEHPKAVGKQVIEVIDAII